MKTESVLKLNYRAKENDLCILGCLMDMEEVELHKCFVSNCQNNSSIILIAT